MRRVPVKISRPAARAGWILVEYLRESLCLAVVMFIIVGALAPLNRPSPDAAAAAAGDRLPVYSLGLADDGRTLWFNCFHRGLVLVNLADGTESDSLRFLHTLLVDADVSASSPRLIGTTTSQGSLRLIRGRDLAVDLESSDGPLADLKVLPDGRTAVGVTNEGVIVTWTWNGQGMNQNRTRTEGSLTLLETSADGRWAAIIADNTELLVYDLLSGAVERRWDVRDAHCSALAISPDGRLIATGGKQENVRVWDRATARLVWEGRCDELGTCALEFSPDGKWLAGGGFNKAIHVWHAADGQRDATLAAHSGTIRALSFHPDGRRLYSGGLDGRVYEWSLESRAVMRSFQ